MNRITNAEREIIHSRALEIIALDAGGMLTNAPSATEQLMVEFNVSRQRARHHVAKAAMRTRGEWVQQGRPTLFGERMEQTSITITAAQLDWLQVQPQSASETIRSLVAAAMQSP